MTEPLTAERLAAIEADLDAAWTELGETNPIVARAVNGSYVLLSRYQRQSAEVTRLTALITAPDGGGIPLPLLDELQSIAAESGCHHQAAIAVAAETAYSVGSEHAEDLRAEVKRANAKLSHLADLHRGEQNARYAAERRLQAVGAVKAWTNEDGRKFVFADDLYEAAGGPITRPVAVTPTVQVAVPTAAELTAGALTIACPSCKAAPHTPCQDRPANHSHIKRRILFGEGGPLNDPTPSLDGVTDADLDAAGIDPSTGLHIRSAPVETDEPNRCPECRLLAAHKPTCGRPVRLMPWQEPAAPDAVPAAADGPVA